MPLKLDEIKQLHDKAYDKNQDTRRQAAEDTTFYWMDQWGEGYYDDVQLGFRGEFNVVRKGGRQIQSDLAENPVQNDFEPKDENRQDAADVLDGMYRADANNNDSIEAFNNADQECVVCGMGAWELYTEYVSNRNGDKKQVIKRRPILEANNNVFCDPNSKFLDKNDADYWSILVAYSEDGYKKLKAELTGEDIDDITVESANFKVPEHSYTFPWIGEGESKKIYVSNFYHRTKITDKILTLTDPFGESTQVKESELRSVMDEMIDSGYEIEDEKSIESWEVRKYIVSGEEILNGEKSNDDDPQRMGEVIPGENIPVIPEYGEHAWIEGEEWWEGCVRLAKDPQRLRNFIYSYMGTIASSSPRDKPIFTQAQIAKFEQMYEITGADNNYPYLLQNSHDAEGRELTHGPVGFVNAPNIPPVLAPLAQMATEAVADVVNPGIPQDIADPDLSGKAILALTARLDKQSVVYQEHRKHARRRDAIVYAGMATVIYDVPRKVKMEMPDGTKKEAEIMESVIDEETGKIVVINDLRNAEFDVYSKIGASYTSQKEQTIDRLEKMLEKMNPMDPEFKAIQLKILQLSDGVDLDDIREYANLQLVVTGFKKPETDEEKEALENAQNTPKEDSADMVLAKGEMLKGQAAVMREKREGINMQLTDQISKAKVIIEQQKIQLEAQRVKTDRMEVQIDAHEAGAKISNTNIDTEGKQLDNIIKVKEIQNPFDGMEDDELVKQIMA
jgi:hypothetical protein